MHRLDSIHLGLAGQHRRERLARGSRISAARRCQPTCHVVTEPEPLGEGAQRGHEVEIIQDGESDDEVRHTQCEQQDAACAICTALSQDVLSNFRFLSQVREPSRAWK